ncbi:outer membrane beta-barrel protein [Nibribacter koreensis]|uniref:Outer membrane protein beta-barrel domain-containing protein n=1 Tax=Nibribacter koreensis TaxID=1084519 RepID=A0ABP8FAT1_9BACT
MKRLLFACLLLVSNLVQAQQPLFDRDLKLSLNQTFTKDELEANDPTIHQYTFSPKTGGSAEVYFSRYVAGSFYGKGGVGLRMSQFGYTIENKAMEAKWQGDQTLLMLTVPLLLENRFGERFRISYGLTPYALLYHKEDLTPADGNAQAAMDSFQDTKYNLVGLQMQVGTSFKLTSNVSLAVDYNYLFSNLIKEQIEQGSVMIPANLRLHTVSAGILYNLNKKTGRSKRL